MKKSDVKSYQLSEVFVRNRDAADSYVVRPEVDLRMQEALCSGKHVIVSGPPGRGKTALVWRSLGELPRSLIHCSRGQKLPDVYRRVMSEAGASVVTGKRLTKKKSLSATFKIFTGDLGAEEETSRREVTLDLGNIGDVIAALGASAFKGWIVLNDYQLLSESAQRGIARDLKQIAETSPIRVIVIGTWFTPDGFRVLAEDSSAYVTYVHVPPWTTGELAEALDRAQELLNVRFAEPVREACLSTVAGAIRNLHELGFALCERARIVETADHAVTINDVTLVSSALAEIRSRPFARYRRLLREYCLQEVIVMTPEEIDDALDGYLTYGLKPSVATRKRFIAWASKTLMPSQNAVLLDQAKQRRAFLEKLKEIDWSKNDGVTASLLVPSDVLLAIMNGDADDDGPYNPIAEFMKRQGKAKLYPPPLMYDEDGLGVGIGDSKFRAFIQETSLQDLRSCFGELPAHVRQLRRRTRARFEAAATAWLGQASEKDE